MAFDNETSIASDPTDRIPTYETRSLVKSDSRSRKQTKDMLHSWWHEARTSDRENRHQQAIDEAYADGEQISEQDAALMEERGQSPLVYNEVLPAVLWIEGTERRTKFDYRILPRTDDDHKSALIKSKLIKYVDDVNGGGAVRSEAFRGAVRAGVGWIEVGIAADAEKEPLFYRFESWRNIWRDPMSRMNDYSDARYLFRSKVLDLDIAIAMFPKHEDDLKRASTSMEQLSIQADADFYDSTIAHTGDDYGPIGEIDVAGNPGKRKVVRLVESWYKRPSKVQVIRGNPKYDGMILDKENPEMMDSVTGGYGVIHSVTRMMVNVAVFIDGGEILDDMPSPYEHNQIPFTPMWCYRRARDNAPYGTIRAQRDPQDDLNKRRSKALFMLSTNRTIMDTNAVPDMDEFEYQVARPNAIIVKRPGAELRIESNEKLAREHVDLALQDAEYVRQSSGVTGENLGLETNATSGTAITARQTQGTVITATVFDNKRIASQAAGRQVLSLMEQFYNEEKVVRISGDRGNMDFLSINQYNPVDGGILNDITASHADFIVSETDHQESVRQANFASTMDMVGKMDSETALKFLDLVYEWSDIPGKEEWVKRFRDINGYPDPDDPEAQARTDQMKAENAEKEAQARALEMRSVEAKAARDEAYAGKDVAVTEKTNVEALIAALQAALQLAQSPGIAGAAEQIIDGAEAMQVAEAIDRQNIQPEVQPGVSL